MAGTNPDAPVIDDDKLTSEEDLRKLKYPDEGVDPPETAADEPEDGADPADEASPAAADDDQIVPPATDEDEELGDEPVIAPPAFVKEFDYIKGDTPEEYAKNLEAAYKNSSSEALRLKDALETAQKPPSVTPPADLSAEIDPAASTLKNPVDLYVQQELDKKIQGAYAITQKEYPQVNDPTEYAKFTKKVATFSQVILDTESRLADPAELYNMAASSLGWEKKTTEPDDKDKLGMAIKTGASVNKTTSAPVKPKPNTPKLSDAQLKLNRKMYPGKTDQEIIEELTPYL